MRRVSLLLLSLLTVFLGSSAFAQTTPGQRPHHGGGLTISGPLYFKGTNIPGVSTNLTVTQRPCVPNGTTTICPETEVNEGSAALGWNTLAVANVDPWSVAIGAGALSHMKGIQEYYVHNNFASAGNGNMNVAIGLWSMGHADATGCTLDVGSGAVNVAVGAMSLDNVTCGHQNVSIGEASSQYITTGQHNTIVGNETVDQTSASSDMSYNSGLGGDIFQYETGNDNTALGWGALGYHYGATGVSGNNTAIGEQSMQGDTATPTNNTGINNAALGNATLFKLTSGGSNLALGNQVGKNTLTTGSRNILIGVSSAIDTGSSSTSDTINIGGMGGSWFLVTGTNTNTTELATMNGALQLAGTSATLGTCTGGTLAAGSTNNKGKVTGITAAASCTINFSPSFTTAPSCMESGSAALASASVSAVSTSSVTFSMTAFTGTLYYLCF